MFVTNYLITHTNMDKLTLSHLSAYMPYGPKIVDVSDGHIFEILSLCNDSFSVYSETEQTRTVYFENNNYPNFKPILRPLSDLNSSLDVLGLSPYFHECFFMDGGIEANVLTCPYADLQHLFSLHYDLFQLIDKSLAVSIHSIK